MPIKEDELEKLEDYKQNTENLPEAISFLKKNQDKGYFYIKEISEETGLAYSTVIETINQNQDKIKEQIKKKNGQKHRYVKYNP
ncbi:MAG: hypothetical protein ABEI78_00595 [Candidatus Nanohaloarchaea archaeon]